MTSLSQLGDQLEQIDRSIIDQISRRMEIARLIGLEKKRTGLPIVRPEVEGKRLEEIAQYARSAGVSPHLAAGVLYALINEASKQQTILLQQPDAK